MNPKFVYWQDGKWWLGYLQEYPDYSTQGETYDDLVEHLKDIYRLIMDGHLTGARRVGELVLT